MTEDWLDLLVALLDGDVRFLVVGAHALAVHGVPRGTQDLDVWIDPLPENAARAWSALAAFGAPLDVHDVTLDDLQRPHTVIQLGLPPDRIDLLTAITGVDDFSVAWDERVEHVVRGLRAPPRPGDAAAQQASVGSPNAALRAADQPLVLEATRPPFCTADEPSCVSALAACSRTSGPQPPGSQHHERFFFAGRVSEGVLAH